MICILCNEPVRDDALTDLCDTCLESTQHYSAPHLGSTRLRLQSLEDTARFFRDLRFSERRFSW